MRNRWLGAGAPLALTPFVLRVTLVVLALAGCRPAATAHAPATPACRPGRIGKVSVAGGSPADVPQLAVLDGTLDDPARTERIRLAAIDTLHARGYPRAAIAVTRRAGCGTELDVSVVPGPPYRIAALDVIAADTFPTAARLAAIEDALGTVNAVGGAYVENRLVRALADLQQRYRAAGWSAAVIDPPHAVFDDARGTVRVTIAIRAGERR